MKFNAARKAPPALSYALWQVGVPGTTNFWRTETTHEPRAGHGA
ncbi:MAG: hypothetical protein WDN00_16050 [Limisphaerales bacterium]